jgi:geranylgeranyl diphosphate synthase type II
MPYNKIFEDYLSSIKFKTEPKGLYDAITYILHLGGKRVRPTLVLIGYSVFEKNNIHQSLPAAAAIELFHNFSLIHDDIMDEAPLRRGKPTVHEIFNINTAILSGDAALVLAYEELLKIPHQFLSTAIKIFNQTALEVCEGQQMDMLFETSTNVLIDDYLEMIRLKTAVLLGCSLQMGALIGNADVKNQQLIYKFGEQIGLAFQLQDDILDTYGNPETFGKQVGGDIIQNKKTYLLLTAFEKSNPAQKQKLKDLLFNTHLQTHEKVNEVKKIFDELKVRDDAEKQMKIHFNNAIIAAQSLNISKQNVDLIINFAEQLMNRTK